MKKEDFQNELNVLVGKYDTNYFRYLLYSYNLSLNEGKLIIEDISNKFDGSDVNLIRLIEDSFRQKIIEIEKNDKVNYLNELISKDNPFYITYLDDYKLSNKFIKLIHDKIENEINENNIEYFMIKRNLKDYFHNKKFYRRYINKLNVIKGRNYDSRIIKKSLNEFNNISLSDVEVCIHEMEDEILDGETYNDDIRKAFNSKLMKKSEKKKADAHGELNHYLDDYGDSFKNILKKFNLTWDDGLIIIDEINTSINDGNLQAEQINPGFVFNYVRKWK